MKLYEEVKIGDKALSLTTGHVAKQANGAVTVRMGDTIVLVTACAKKEAAVGGSFLPLTVDYRENSFAAGKIPGGFFKREGKLSENETLVCRLTDRSLRPLFPDGYFNETQVIASTISHDLVNQPDVMTIIGASAALTISEIPYDNPIAAVKIGLIDGELIVNPEIQELEKSNLDLLVASSADAILMVEAGAKEVDEETMVKALQLGFESAQPIIEMQRKLQKQLGNEKWAVDSEEIPKEIYKAVSEKIEKEIIDALNIKEKIERGQRLDEIKKSAVEMYEEDSEDRIYAGHTFDEVKKKVFRDGVFSKRIRFDGRAFDQVRDITCELDFLPRAHGSAIFTRGETQALASVTLGTKSDAQIMDELGGEWKRRFMLHYNFPPFSVGEVRFMRGPGRREIGHGALASRALEQVLPSEEDFPYTLRIVSDILESNGSSSMATVCGGSLSMMAAGVPIKSPVAGIAMGLLKNDDDFIVLSDIAGEEDHYGDMDFKVAGTQEGITALQMDIKIAGVTMEVLRQALAQAKAGREHILGIMGEAIKTARTELSAFAPRIVSMKIDTEKIRDIIGKGGSVIRSIIEDSGAEVDVEDDGTVLIYSPDKESLDKAKARIEEIIEVPEVGKVYNGKVVSTVDFGAFVQILPAVQGLLHISEIANYRVNQVTDELNVGDDVRVKVIEIDKASGKVRLSRKALMGGGPSGDGSDNRGGGNPRSSGGYNRSGGSSSGSRGRSNNQRRSSSYQKNDGGSNPRYRSRRGPQNNSNSGNRGGNDDNRFNASSSGGRSFDDKESIRFPGDLGPDPMSNGFRRKKF